MARLIDADAFLEEARNRIDMQDVYLPIHIKYFVIDEMPTIDAVEVVRCKDCKHNWVTSYNHGVQDEPRCKFTSYKLGLDDYCSYGEKTDEDEISNIAKESAGKIAKALKKVRAKGMQKQNIKEDDEP